MPDLDELRPRLVVPFYLKMMRLNPIGSGPTSYPGDLLADVRRVAATVERAEIETLLGAFWRERVMGAWYAVARGDTSLRDAMTTALTTSVGSLDSPPLVTAAVVLFGADALPAIHHYAEQDMTWNWGAAGIATAAADVLEPGYARTHGLQPPTVEDRERFGALLRVAQTLQR